jgi:hypothetical protein
LDIERTGARELNVALNVRDLHARQSNIGEFKLRPKVARHLSFPCLDARQSRAMLLSVRRFEPCCFELRLRRANDASSGQLAQCGPNIRLREPTREQRLHLLARLVLDRRQQKLMIFKREVVAHQTEGRQMHRAAFNRSENHGKAAREACRGNPTKRFTFAESKPPQAIVEE